MVNSDKNLKTAVCARDAWHTAGFTRHLGRGL